FGDGSAYAGPYSSSQTSHTYTVCGSYTVRVEAVNNWGNAVIGQTTTTIDVACAYTIILPIIMNP
ncbi:MAG: PKD domain-containing protein, partial [Chloroflexi bacterium]|nr:PKD domain-containing protein [Chloroflexota bacterium]